MTIYFFPSRTSFAASKHIQSACVCKPQLLCSCFCLRVPGSMDLCMTNRRYPWHTLRQEAIAVKPLGFLSPSSSPQLTAELKSTCKLFLLFSPFPSNSNQLRVCVCYPKNKVWPPLSVGSPPAVVCLGSLSAVLCVLHHFPWRGGLWVSCSLLCDKFSYICTQSRPWRVQKKNILQEKWKEEGTVRKCAPSVQLVNNSLQIDGKLLLGLSFNVNIYLMRVRISARNRHWEFGGREMAMIWKG